MENHEEPNEQQQQQQQQGPDNGSAEIEKTDGSSELDTTIKTTIVNLNVQELPEEEPREDSPSSEDLNSEENQDDNPSSNGKSPITEHWTVETLSPQSNQVSQPDSPENGSEKSPESPPNDSPQPQRSVQSSKGTSSQDNNNQEGLDGSSSTLGRNRRVRQKNRYLLDFHCIDLTKGGRSKEDFSLQAPSIRTSNRRSTTDSSRGQQDDPDVFETKYCRKCSLRTAHDFDGGCQVCLYNKIVSSSKRQKPHSQKNRSTSRQQRQQQQTQHDNESGLTTTTTNSNKRKATRQGGGATKISNNININSSSNFNNFAINNISNNANNKNTITNTNHNNTNNSNDSSEYNNVSTNRISASTTTTINSNDLDIKPKTKLEDKVECNNIENGIAELPRLDSWTPDEVAEYILSRGFVNEAQLFKSQSVDGISLLLMQRTDFTYGLKMKLGPALKIYDQVCKLKKEYFRRIATT